MKKGFRLLKLTILSLGCTVLQAREFRTPLTPLDAPPLYGYIHYPIVEIADDDECYWDFDVYGGAYHRRADKAYSCEFGTETEPLAAIFFGQPEFRLEEAFANSTAIVPRNPWVNISVIAPELEYEEEGAVFGFSAGKLSSDGCMHYGFRAKLPVRYITIRDNRCNCVGTTIGDVALLSNERYPQGNPDSNTVLNVFAYRLDFLASLRDPDGVPFLNFSNPNQMNDVTWAGTTGSLNLTNGNMTNGIGEISGAKVHLLGRKANGAIPTPNFGLRNTPAAPEVNALGALPADGSGLVFPNRAVFSSAINYGGLAPNSLTSANNPCNVGPLSNIFVVPTITNDGSPVLPENLRMTDLASQLSEQVQQLIRTLDSSVLSFLEEANINLGTQHQEGVGDLNTEIYFGYDLDDCLYGEWQFGVKFPTGKKVRDASSPFLVPLGNNGHVELRIGGLLNWEATDWLFLHVDSTYSWALKNCESVAAPFQGACIKNIGPCTQAEISWNYFLAHFNVTIVPPCNPYVGFALGYEPYVKQRDKIRFSGDTALDFQGNPQTLDPSVLEQRTRVTSQRIITEFFYVECAYNFYAGWTHVFAGQNAPKDTDFYVGFSVDF